MLNYQYTIDARVSPTTNDTKLIIRKLLVWTDQDPQEKITRAFLDVRGKLSERGSTWDETWSFSLNKELFNLINGAVEMIGNYVDSNHGFQHAGPKEVFCDINDRIRIGWVFCVSEKGELTWYGYARFSKDDFNIEARFKECEEMRNFGRLIYHAVN